MMDHIFFNLLLSSSIAGTLLFGFWLIFRFFFKKKSTKRFQYYLLLIILARFLVPITAEKNLMQIIYGYLISTTFYKQIFGDPLSNHGSINIHKNVIIGENVTLGSANSYSKYIFMIWFVVFFFLLVQKITRYQSFCKYIRANWVPVDTPETLDLLSSICEEKNITAIIELYTTPLVSSPLLFGIRKSYIVLPDEKLPKEQLYSILIHEVSHYKNKDLFIKWLVQMTISIHWFNPIVYYIEKVVNAECEYACDESAIRNLTNKQCYDYGDTLIAMTKTKGNYNDRIASVTLYENRNEIKKRLTAILEKNTVAQPNKLILSLITVSFILLSFYIGAYYQ